MNSSERRKATDDLVPTFMIDRQGVNSAKLTIFLAEGTKLVGDAIITYTNLEGPGRRIYSLKARPQAEKGRTVLTAEIPKVSDPFDVKLEVLLFQDESYGEIVFRPDDGLFRASLTMNGIELNRNLVERDAGLGL